MQFRRSILLLSLVLLTVIGQSQYFHIQRVGVRQGLASANAYCVYEDQQGYLWVGTDLGASRYDGYTFANYTTGGEERLGQVNAFTETPSGQLLLGSSQGLFYWTGLHFEHLPVVESGITDLLFDLQENLWIAGEDGVFMLSPSSLAAAIQGKATTVQASTDAVAEFADDPRTTDLLLGHNGEIYASTYFFLMVYENNHWTRLWGAPNYKPDIVRIAEVRPGQLALACEDGQFLEWQDGQIRPLNATLALGLDIQVSDDQLFLLTYDRFAIQRGDEIQLIIDADEHLPEWMRSFTFDRHGTIWIATFEGLLKVQGTPFRWLSPEDYPAIGEVYAFGEDEQGQLLIGSNRGSVLTPQEGEFVPFFPTYPRLVPSAEIFAIHRGTSGDLWFGTGYQGIVRMWNGQRQHFTDIGGLGDDARFFFLAAKDGSLWSGGDGGVDQLIFTGDSIAIRNYQYETGSQQYAIFNNGVVASDGRLWLAGNYGLFQLRADSLLPTAIEGFPEGQLSINDLLLDPQDQLWIATSGAGILQCDYHQDGYWVLGEQYDKADGLNSNAFLQLLVDQQGTLWASNYIGLCQISADGFIRCYDEQDGFIDRSYTNLCLFQDAGQRIWAGSSEGVIVFHPDSLHRNELPPELYLEGVQLFNGRESVAPYISRTADPTTPDLRLPYHQNHLTFQLAGINLSQPEKTQFRHRLLGQSTAWTTSAYQASISYPKLPPGQYIFEVAAANEDGLWSEPLSYTFYIQRPFWQQWWFFALLAAAAIGIIYLIFRDQHRRNLIKQQVIESKLEALRAQMNPHFLSNALNAINYFILDNNAFAASRYLTKFSRLIRLILDHSQSAQITLAKELEALDLYLELEKLRYEDKFEFTIEVDEGITPQLVLIPPLIIQPFAENAVWHGFMNHTSVGQLCIRIGQDGELLTCSIQDNGIGRAAARAHQRSRGKATGQGHQLTANRLQLLLKETPNTQAIQIIDLADEQGQALGTRVEISWPLVFAVN